MTMIPPTSSPFLPPTMARDTGAIADPTPAPMPRAVGSGANDVVPAIRPPSNPPPDLSKPPAERASESARELYHMPTSLPPTVPTVATPRHLQASESDAAAAATFVHGLQCPPSSSADL
ncbi:uncharacterized protein LOC119449192 [Dermacentor silvarum]|uniref:uncharacterized protein LOC119449192 n=1 Tax=Dermacentor silvarum TaxID=543639 RepID=UPI00189BEB60|nr:uncharacterized protein LOC119449192 [Dermacentor silvarum]